MGVGYEIIMQVFNILGVIIRFLGVVILGAALGWMAFTAFKKDNAPWYYQAVVLVVFFGFFALILWRGNAGWVGGLSLGAGATFLWMTMRKPAKAADVNENTAEAAKKVRKTTS